MQALTQFLQAAERLSVALTNKQTGQIELFCKELQDYNTHTNLVSDGSPETVLSEHVLDSLSLVPLIKNSLKDKGRLIDIGTGAGFPGLMLAIAIPELDVVLVDSVGKKLNFITSVLGKLELSHSVQIYNGRAEELSHQGQYRAQFDIATCRAVGAGIGLVCEMVCPFLKTGGHAFLQKSLSQCNALSPAASQNADKLGAKLIDTVDLSSQLGKPHGVLVMKQMQPCAAKYPRPWNQIKTKPLF
jgi:16S rRNA (guanine527-N7)-methyltransferase